MSKKYTGEITYFRGAFGFIKCPEFSYAVYFHKNDISKSYPDNVKKGDFITFTSGKNLKSPDKIKAYNVEFAHYNPPTFAKLGKLNVHFSPEDSFLGKIKSWSLNKGYINTAKIPELDIFLYYTRLLAPTVSPGDIVVFQPIKSIDHRSVYFAQYAVPVADIDENWIMDELLEHDRPFYKANHHFFRQKFPKVSDTLELVECEDYTRLVGLFNDYCDKYGGISIE